MWHHNNTQLLRISVNLVIWPWLFDTCISLIFGRKIPLYVSLCLILLSSFILICPYLYLLPSHLTYCFPSCLFVLSWFFFPFILLFCIILTDSWLFATVQAEFLWIFVFWKEWQTCCPNKCVIEYVH